MLKTLTVSNFALVDELEIQFGAGLTVIDLEDAVAAEDKETAREAALAVRDWAYGTRGLGALVSYIDPENARSIRLAERLGAMPDDGAPQPAHDPCLVYRHSASEVPR